ncbi:MAG: proliferating cell nuclear antigen (pcna) [Candidatus Aenigmatarchaeota archaeon]
MFKLMLSDGNLLKDSIPVIAEIIDEGVFKIDSKGMSLVSPDRSMIALVDFQILPSAFDEFKVTGENYIGLNLSNFVAVIKRIKTGEKVILTKDDNSNTLEIIMKGKSTRKFEIPLLNISVEKPPVDQLKFKNKVELDASVLEEGIADAEIVDDSVVFEAEPHAFRIWAKGEVNSSQLELKKGEGGLEKIEVAEPIKARYPIDYLKKMIKASKLAEKVVLEYANDYPLRLVFKDMEKMKLSFILAPRVEE